MADARSREQQAPEEPARSPVSLAQVLPNAQPPLEPQPSDVWLGKQGRLTHPMVLREGSTHYEPLSWDEAFALVAEELNALGSPDQACFYTSGRTSNEAAFLYQLFVRQFGTNNLPDCS